VAAWHGVAWREAAQHEAARIETAQGAAKQRCIHFFFSPEWGTGMQCLRMLADLRGRLN
jgi:hypothetical protein